MNPLEPQEPHALIQFALVALLGLFFAAVLIGYCA